MTTEVVSPPATTEPQVEGSPVVAAEGDVAATGEVAKASEAGEDSSSPKKEPPAPKPQVRKLDFEQDVVYLYQFPRAPTIPSVSGYCLKVETFLRVAAIKYENVDNRMKYKSKKGQLPFIELNGEEIADSDIIIKELTKKFDKNLNEGLTQDQLNQSHAFESMLNNHTSWIVRWWRYSHPEEFMSVSQLDIKKSLNSKLPKGVLNILFKWGFKRNISGAVDHGIGHHTPEEAVDFGKSDLKALSTLLGDKDYFFGKEPHVLDCVAFGHISQFVYVPFAGIREWMDTDTANLVAFCERVKGKYFPDWEEMTRTLEINTHLPKKELTPEQVEEAKKLEEKKVEEAKKKKEKEEKKKQKEEEAKKKKEEKEKKKKEEAEAKAKAAAEKAEKEKAEKEKKEAEAKAAAEAKKAAEEAAAAAKKLAEETAAAEAKKVAEEAAAAAATATAAEPKADDSTPKAAGDAAP